MSPERYTREVKLKKIHMTLCGAGAGLMLYRGLEYASGIYSITLQLACIAGGFIAAYYAVKHFYRPARPDAVPDSAAPPS